MEEQTLAGRVQTIEDAVREEAEKTAAYLGDQIGPFALRQDERRIVWNGKPHGQSYVLYAEVLEGEERLFDVESRTGRSPHLRVRFPQHHPISFSDAVWELAQEGTDTARSIAGLPEAYRSVRDALQRNLESMVPAGQSLEEPSTLPMDLERVQSLYHGPLTAVLQGVGRDLSPMVSEQEGISYTVGIHDGSELQVTAAHDDADLFTVLTTTHAQRKHWFSTSYDSFTTIRMAKGRDDLPRSFRGTVADLLYRAVQWEDRPESFVRALRNLVPAVQDVYQTVSRNLAAHEPRAVRTSR